MLCDKDIKTLLRQNPALVSPIPGIYKNLDLGNGIWDDYESPIQSASIDLHAGKIFVPDVKKGEKGSEGHGADEYVIKQGESVIVSTYEKLELPNNIGAIVFPPSGKLSSKGILVSNIGHIDPGYKGHLRFTLINMGNESFPISSASTIVGTLLLFRTTDAADNGWLNRACIAGKVDVGGGKKEPGQGEIDALASSFAGMEKKMQAIADERLTALRYQGWNLGLPVILTTIVSLMLYGYSVFFGDLNELSSKNQEFQKQLFSQRTEILNLEKELIETRKLIQKPLGQ